MANSGNQIFTVFQSDECELDNSERIWNLEAIAGEDDFSCELESIPYEEPDLEFQGTIWDLDAYSGED